MKKYIIFAFLLPLFFFSSCMEDYLDEPTVVDEGAISPELAFGTETGVKATMAGILRETRTQFSMDGVYNTDAGGIYAMLYARSVKGNDLVNPTGWYNFDYNHGNREPTYRRTLFTWNFSYFIIAKLNQFIDGVQTYDLKDDKAFINPYLAQARTLRAYYYFQLAMEFQHTYAKDPNAVAPPVYEHISTVGKGMSTLDEMYAFILSDLKFATKDAGLTAGRDDKSWVNIEVANGIAANVYLVMEKWTEALDAAQKAVGVSNASGVQSVLNTTNSYVASGFDDMSDKEWIWAIPQQADQSNYYYMGPHSFTDHVRGAYKSGYINVEFAKKFSQTDVRGKVIYNLYNSKDDNYKARVTDKFVFKFTSDAPLMRSPEMVLVMAETNYRLGKIQEAQDFLYALQLARDEKAVKSSATGVALLEEILLERRKELYGEIGVEWFDAKRLQRGIVRDGNHSNKLTLTPNDNRFILKIPQKEIDANPNIPKNINDNK